MFLCPSISPNNPNGMWVIGGSGVYYVNFPGLSSPNWNMPDNLNPFAAIEDKTGSVLPNGKDFPADLEAQAQVKAGKGLYNKLDGVPAGTIVMVLPDDGTGHLVSLGLPDGIMGPVTLYPESDPSNPDPDNPYWDSVTHELWANVELKSAAFW